MTEDEMAGWHHRLSGHEFKQALGDGAAAHGVTKGWALWMTKQQQQITKTVCYWWKRPTSFWRKWKDKP